MEFQLLIAIGAMFIGVLIGLTGVGGGALLTPFLILMGVQPSVAVGSDLIQMTVTKLLGAWQYQRHETVNGRLVCLLAIGSIPGSLVGVALLIYLRHSLGVAVDLLITRVLGATLVLVAVLLLLRLLRRPGDSGRRAGLLPPQKFLLPLLGGGIGVLVGISSVGSGSLFLVALTFVFGLPMAEAVGTDLLHAAVLTASAGLAHLCAGNVDVPLAANVLVGTVPGVVLGSRLAIRLPENGLHGVVAMLLLVVGISLI